MGQLYGGISAMNKRLVIAALFATATLSGCVTYDHVGRGAAPGGYYYGRPTTEYYDPYGYGGYPYSGGVSIYGGYGSGGYGYTYYGHYGSYYPYYRPHYYPRPPRPGDGRPPPPNPPPTARPGNRPPPWRDPTRGAYRETGQVLIPPRSQPQYQRPAPSSSQIRGDNPPRMVPRHEPRNEVSRPRSIERADRPAVRSAPRVRTQEP
jgi:hypothetical protein